jgi:nucleoside 2-deoxyribosyltransferase
MVSRFIVANMTEARPNCYYELGIAHALGKEVIHIAREMKDVHFDVNDFNFIVYEHVDDLKGRLRERIQKTIGRF